jgi:ankyrin repeat protein
VFARVINRECVNIHCYAMLSYFRHTPSTAEIDATKLCVHGPDPLIVAIIENNTEKFGNVIRGMTDRRFEVNIRMKDGSTAIQEAIKREQMFFVGSLLKNGADTENVDNTDSTPLLTLAQINGDVSVLLHYNANVNVMDMYGHTPLHYAIHFDSVRNCEAILQFRPDVTWSGIDSTNISAYQMALDNKHTIGGNCVIKWIEGVLKDDERDKHLGRGG